MNCSLSWTIPLCVKIVVVEINIVCYAGKVQYKAYLSELTRSVFTAISIDYSPAVDAKTPYVLPDTTALIGGCYRLSVWVKRAGETGVKTTVNGSYDNYKILELGVGDVNILPAERAILALQTAAAKDLTIAANLTRAEALVQPAKDADRKSVV